MLTSYFNFNIVLINLNPILLNSDYSFFIIYFDTYFSGKTTHADERYY